MSGERGWSYSEGEYGSKVRVWERLNDDGEVTSIYRDYYDGEGNLVRKSLGHPDRDKAKQQALDMHLALEDAKERHATGNLALIDISTLHQKHVSAKAGERTRNQHEAWWDGLCRFFGPKTNPLDLRPGDTGGVRASAEGGDHRRTRLLSGGRGGS